MQALNRTRHEALGEGPWKTAARRVDDNDIVTIEGKALGESGGVLLDEAHVPKLPEFPGLFSSGGFRIGPGVRERLSCALDPKDLSGRGGEGKREKTDAAIQVDPSRHRRARGNDLDEPVESEPICLKKTSRGLPKHELAHTMLHDRGPDAKLPWAAAFRLHDEALKPRVLEKLARLTLFECTYAMTRLDEKSTYNPPWLVAGFLKLDRFQSARSRRILVEPGANGAPSHVQRLRSEKTMLDVVQVVARPPAKSHHELVSTS